MFERFVDNRLLRLVLGTAIGLPLTAAALVAAVEAAVLSIGALQRAEYLIAGLGPLAILGLLGIAGAWRRLLRTNERMTYSERRFIRVFLYAGTVSSITLVLVSIFYFDSMLLSLLFVVLGCGGVIFILATPLRSNISVQGGPAASGRPPELAH
jgi:hypothetical protein